MMFKGHSFWVVAFNKGDIEELGCKIKKYGGLIVSSVYEATRVIFLCPTNIDENKTNIPKMFQALKDAEELDQLSDNCKSIAADWICQCIKEGKIVSYERYKTIKSDLLNKAFWEGIKSDNEQPCIHLRHDSPHSTELLAISDPVTDEENLPLVEFDRIEVDEKQAVEKNLSLEQEPSAKMAAVGEEKEDSPLSEPDEISGEVERAHETHQVDLVVHHDVTDVAVSLRRSSRSRARRWHQDDQETLDSDEESSDSDDDQCSSTTYVDAEESDKDGHLEDKRKKARESAKNWRNRSTILPEDQVCFDALVKDLKVQVKKGFELGGIQRYLRGQKVFNLYTKYRDLVKEQVPGLPDNS